MSATRYRAEIDGLRAVAVVPVVLFHAGLSGFSGGFVGVDVFFVISGYLITAILLRDAAAGRPVLASFYERRVRRILPALLLVSAATVPAAWLVLTPGAYLEFSESLFAVGTFWSNVYFWQQSGYFDRAAELRPLLHTWSLAVEEQYYLLFPLALLLLVRRARERMQAIFLAAGLVSLLISELWLHGASQAAFFLLPSRAWELLLGAWLSQREFDAGPPAGRDRFALTGLVAIGLAVLFYDSGTAFPGVAALLPVGGTALVIAFARPGTLTHRLLALRPLVLVGLLSYSIYLWHQPVFAILRESRGGAAPVGMLLLAALLVLPLSYLSWRFVERPARDRARLPAKFALPMLAGLSVSLLVVGGWGHVREGFPERFGVPPAVLATIERPTAEACFDAEDVHRRADWFCELGRRGAPEVFVFGDSHALSLLGVLDGLAEEAGLAVRFAGASGCTPLLGVHALRADQATRDCHALNERVLEQVREENIRTVVLIARWAFYTDGGHDPRDFSYIGGSADAPRSREVSRATFEAAVAETLARYRAIGTRLVVVGQVPHQRRHPEAAYIDAYGPRGRLASPASVLRESSVERQRNTALLAYSAGAFERAAAAGALDYVAPTPILCDDVKCPMGTPDASYYFDEDHLSVTGARLLRDALAARLLEPAP